MLSKYYCTCDKGKKIALEYHTVMKLTEVGEDGECIYCGFYAMKSAAPPNYRGRLKQEASVSTKQAQRRKWYAAYAASKGVDVDYSKDYDPSYIEELRVLE